MSYTYARTVQAGCTVCHGETFHWFGPNSQGVAARHHQATGHRTVVEVWMSLEYGGELTPERAAEVRAKREAAAARTTERHARRRT